MKLFILLFVLGALNANPVGEPDKESESGKFQGDIALTSEQEQEVEKGSRDGRTGIINTYYRWLKINGKVVVPYVIDNVYTSSERYLIDRAILEIESKTCVDFVPRTNQADYIRIFSGSGCWSYLGRIRGKQDLSIMRNGCVNFGIIMHELIHALGYGHMHQHPDRDARIRVNYQNIQAGNAQWFDKLKTSEYNNFGTPYDVSSVMHYGAYSFSNGRGPTLQAYSAADANVMGQRSYLSGGDITRIRNMYQC